ncbi:MAG: flagellar basal body rod protein FlgC [Planctomycetes bacterium]|nr:flagellar basal body rod protein FlgC [Planctomycetota bacterium]
MGFEKILSATDISASGLAAERIRMEVVANNIANAHSTRSAGGGPFRRQDVIFSALLNERPALVVPGQELLGGVEILGIEDDPSELLRVYQPGHPDAGRDGYVTMPNVQLPIEMVNLITASRAYEANLRVLRSFRQMAEQALALMRG